MQRRETTFERIRQLIGNPFAKFQHGLSGILALLLRIFFVHVIIFDVEVERGLVARGNQAHDS